ncbi:hypothetical protein [Patiriisocius sp. Uisw_017]|uniref:hypothetical protein n=1 Tax=Patiriisocius sp. Uisw_017 TaxID=3230968 RepID=UPI0039E80434
MVKREGIAIKAATVYLIDKELGTITHLTLEKYTFVSGEGNFPNRFKVVFSEEEILGLNAIALDVITIHPNPASNFITIDSPTALISDVTLRDMQGKTIAFQNNLNTNG